MILPFLNKKRLLAYPFLLLIAIWLVTLLNMIFANGWNGRFGGFISYDFLSFYGGGKLYWTDTANLYNQDVLANLQSQLVGIPKSGMNYFGYPPNAGFVYGLFSFLPYSTAFVIWTALSVACFVISALLIYHYLVPQDLKKKGVTQAYLLVLIFSFYPAIFGLQNGQNHAHSLLLITLITILTFKQRQFLAGACAALLLYKPQILLGWIILWFLLKSYKALLAFVLTGAAWVGVSLLYKGLSPYLNYLRYIPQVAGVLPFGHVWEVTPIAIINRLMIFLFGTTNLTIISLLAVIGFIIGMVFIVHRYPSSQQPLPLMLALLFPLLNFHSMFYDLVLLFPLFVLWSQLSRSKILLLTAICIYISALFLPIISEVINFPVMGILPVLLLIAISTDVRSLQTFQKDTETTRGL